MNPLSVSALAAALLAPALALAQTGATSPANPSRPDLDRPAVDNQPSDVPSRDIQRDRGLDPDERAAPPPGGFVAEQQGGSAQGLGTTEVVARIHADDVREIELGNLAQAKGGMPEVRELGQMLVRDHERLDRELRRFAEAHGITVRAPEPISPADQELMAEQDAADARLQELRPGGGFDRQFAETILQGHSDTIALVDMARSRAQAADVRRFFGDVLPVLRKHRDLAADVIATLETGVTGTSGSDDGVAPDQSVR